MDQRHRIEDLERRIASLEHERGASPARAREQMAGLVGRRRMVALVVLAVAALAPGVVLASHQFSDVPTSHTFHGDISALANAGVTSGCGGGKYCPEAYVTRGQMAGFLNRLGALSSGKTPVVNATKLDGYDSTAFSRPAYATVRPDECFQGPLSNRCSIYDDRNVDHVRRIATGTYCVAPAAGFDFSDKTPSLTTDAFNSGPANGFGVPIVAYSSLVGPCLEGEVKVLTYRATGSTPTVALSDATSFAIVIP